MVEVIVGSDMDSALGIKRARITTRVNGAPPIVSEIPAEVREQARGSRAFFREKSAQLVADIFRIGNDPVERGKGQLCKIIQSFTGALGFEDFEESIPDFERPSLGIF